MMNKEREGELLIYKEEEPTVIFFWEEEEGGANGHILWGVVFLTVGRLIRFWWLCI